MKRITKILVATDFSACSDAAAVEAARLAQQLDGAADVVTVVDTGPLLEAYGDVAFREERIAAIRGEAKSRLEAFVGKHFAGVKEARGIVRDGHVLQEILGAAADGGCDLIVLGTRGHSALAQLLVGSIADKVVRHSPIPVLTVSRRSTQE